MLKLLFVIFLLPSCALIKREGKWGKKAIYPLSMENVKRSFVKQVKSPHVWGPLAGAAVISGLEYDKKISRWATERHPIYGSEKNASHYSDLLSDGLLFETYASIFITPSWDGSYGDYFLSKGKGAVVTYFSVNLAEDFNNNIRKPVSRMRPNKSDRRSFPSGHATRTGASNAVLQRNIDAANLGESATTSLHWVNGISAAGMMWSRVEAKAHYPTDVLVGYSLGYFVSGFIFDVFMNLEANETVAIYPQGNGSVSALYTLGF